MSLSVRGPGLDYTKTRGLCGTFDRDSSNDFHDCHGGALDPADVHGFIEHWRSDGSSSALFFCITDVKPSLCVSG